MKDVYIITAFVICPNGEPRKFYVNKFNRLESSRSMATEYNSIKQAEPYLLEILQNGDLLSNIKSEEINYASVQREWVLKKKGTAK